MRSLYFMVGRYAMYVFCFTNTQYALYKLALYVFGVRYAR